MGGITILTPFSPFIRHHATAKMHGQRNSPMVHLGHFKGALPQLGDNKAAETSI
jgi:hypothetical protein